MEAYDGANENRRESREGVLRMRNIRGYRFGVPVRDDRIHQLPTHHRHRSSVSDRKEQRLPHLRKGGRDDGRDEAPQPQQRPDPQNLSSSTAELRLGLQGFPSSYKANGIRAKQAMPRAIGPVAFHFEEHERGWILAQSRQSSM